MNGTITPTTDRRLLAEVSRWRKANGWKLSQERGWINAENVFDATVAVDYHPYREGFTVARKDDRRRAWPLYPDFHATDSIRQAVDMLVALDILPAKFASAYQAGYEDAVALTGADGPWKALIVHESYVADDFSELSPEDEVDIVIVRDSALPDDEGHMPGTYKSDDVAFEAEDIYVDGDGGTDAPTIYARAQVMAAALNAAEVTR